MSKSNETLDQTPLRAATRAEFMAANSFCAIPAFDNDHFQIFRHVANETEYKYIELRVPLDAHGHADTQDQADANVGLAVTILNADVPEPVHVIQAAQFSDPVHSQGAFTMRYVSSFQYMPDPKNTGDAEISSKVCSILNRLHSVPDIIKDQPDRH
ncbi:MAG: hypothetical protein LBE58_05240 [Comamonas sp.]|jgi:hypothetical protein|nr:hypothetical protein [Comamonas sp.]